MFTAQLRRIGDTIELLQTIGFLQHNQLAAAEIALLDWCPPTAVRLALEAGKRSPQRWSHTAS